MTDPKLKSLVERIERLEEERKAIGGDVRDIYTEAKSAKYNPKALRKIIAMRRQKADPLVDAEVEAYRAALGMAVDMVSNGEVSLRKAAKATGVSKSSIHRALAVPAASHDLKTREDTDAAPRGSSLPTAPQDAGVCTTRAQSVPDGGVGADTNSVEGGAPNSVRDGGAPVATSTVGPAVTTISSREAFAHLDELMAAEDDLAIPAHLKRERVA